MSALRLIPGDAERLDGVEPSMRLEARSRRPGLAHEELELRLDRLHAERACKMAATEGVPLSLWTTIAIESQRALRVATGGVQVDAMARGLDWAARRRLRPSGRSTRLAAYATALRYPPRPQQPVPASNELPLLVPYHSLLGWEIAAQDAGVSLNNWALAQLAAARPHQHLWEAASAETGQMLAEWIALQVVRRLTN